MPGQEALITAGVRGFDPDALVRARKARGLSQEALGEAVGRARTNIIPWEKVAGDTPSPRNLVLLAQVLDVQPWELTTVDPEAAELADLRAWAGLTQRELADAAQIARSSYSLLERGGLPLHAEVAERIAAELGRTVEEVQRGYERSKVAAGSRRGAVVAETATSRIRATGGTSTKERKRRQLPGRAPKGPTAIDALT